LLSIDHANADHDPTPSQNKNYKPLFTTIKDTTIVPIHKHVDNYYDDFEYEILLPHKTSTFGPEVTVGDLNGDGLDDFIVSGAHNNQAGIYFQSQNGFKKQFIFDIANDSEYEDLGSIIFDADNDGDNDIYMVSGGNEFSFKSELLQDRLYVNDGSGKFTKSSTALPEMITSGQRVYSIDYDKDGDLDMMVFLNLLMLPIKLLRNWKI